MTKFYLLFLFLNLILFLIYFILFYFLSRFLDKLCNIWYNITGVVKKLLVICYWLLVIRIFVLKFVN